MKRMVHWYRTNKGIFWKISLLILLVLFLLPIITTKRVSLNKEYTSVDQVALYLKTYHELPSNYITKYGKDNAPNHGGDISDRIMGGDTHWNEGQLAAFRVDANTPLKECDIRMETYTLLPSLRGTYRLVYTTNTKNVRVFYTEDHYTSFTEITTFHLQLTRNIFWMIFGAYSIVLIAFVIYAKKKEGNNPDLPTETL